MEPIDTAPHSESAEREALALLLSYPSLAEGADLRPRDFYARAYRTMLEAILALRAQGALVDAVTVAHELRRIGKLEEAGGIQGISATMDTSGAPSSFKYYLGAVRAHAARREIHDLAHIIRAIALDDALEPGQALARVQDAVGHAAQVVAPSADRLDLTGAGIDTFMGPSRPREWLIRNTFTMGALAILAAPGGAGKGMTLLDLALSVAGAGGYALGNRIDTTGRVLAWLAEDSRPEVHLRLHAIDPTYDRRAAAKGKLWILCGGAAGQALFAADRTGYQVTPAWHRLCRSVAEIRPVLVILDPLSSFAGVDLDADNAACAHATSHLAGLADLHGCTILLSHHLRKSHADGIDAMDKAREAIRGGSGLVNGGRASYALVPLGEAAGRDVCQRLDEEYRRGRAVVGGVVKSNAPADMEPRVYLRSLTSGLLEDVTEREKASRSRPKPKGEPEATVLLVQAVRDAWRAQDAFTVHGARGLYARREDLPGSLQGMSKRRLEKLALDAVEAGLLVHNLDRELIPPT
jgi:hypothetical protein